MYGRTNESYTTIRISWRGGWFRRDRAHCHFHALCMFSRWRQRRQTTWSEEEVQAIPRASWGKRDFQARRCTCCVHACRAIEQNLIDLCEKLWLMEKYLSSPLSCAVPHYFVPDAVQHMTWCTSLKEINSCVPSTSCVCVCGGGGRQVD